MQRAAQAVVGEHDFTSFCRKTTILIDGKKREASLTREVISIAVKSEGSLLKYGLLQHPFVTKWFGQL